MASSLSYLLPGVLIQVMIVLGLITALVLVIVRRSQLGRAGIVAVVGIAVLILDALLGLLFPFTSGLVAEGLDGFESPGGYLAVIGVYNVLSALLLALGLGLIIGAVFIGRSGPSPAPAQAQIQALPTADPPL
ncbi:MAG TPA: hypothetical protein VF062_15805 [Candidatus Limnocylindrales bacterium]